jgi:UDP-glucose 4-epimerase
MEKILVTDGAGFIGSHLVDLLVDNGYEVIVVDNLSTGKRENLNKQARFYDIDIRSKVKLAEIFKKEKPQIVNHHAAQISVTASLDNPVEDFEINALGTLNLLECSRKYAVKKFLFASTGGAIYGEPPEMDLPVPETYQVKPLSPYGISKYTCELYLKLYANLYNLPYVAMRYANVYGPRQSAEGEAGVIAIFTKKILLNERPTIYGDGFQERDFIYVSDVVKANLLAIKSTEAENQEINISTGESININEIFSLISRSTGYKGKADYADERQGEVKKIALNNKKVRKLLGWEPSITIEGGIKKTTDWFKKYLKIN